MKKLLLSPWILALLAAPAFAFGGVVVFEGPNTGPGNVRVYDETNGALLSAPPELMAITVLAVDFTGRTRVDEFRSDRPRLRSEPTGEARIVLQNDLGALYHYRRSPIVGNARFGYMHVAPNGSVRSLIEIDGVGVSAQSDPFLSRVAVSPTGDAFLAGTVPEAGGNLIEVNVIGPLVLLDRTSNQPPRRFSPNGLALSDTFGVGVCARGVFRFSRATSAPAVPVSTGANGSVGVFTGQVVLSRDGQWAATTAGADSANLHVYGFGANDALRRFTDVPAAVSIAGFMPEADDGPFLAVSDDGEQCAWRTEGVSREVFLGRPQVQVVPPLQISSNTNFLDTLDEVGLFVFRPGGSLIVGIGERPLPGVNAIEKMDLFSVTSPAGGGSPLFTNLSVSSGDATLPFTAVPQISPDGIFSLPDGSAIVYHDTQPTHGTVSMVRTGQTGVSVLLANVKSLDMVEFSGPYMLLSIRRSDGSKPQELYRIPIDFSSPAALVASQPSGTLFVRPAPRRETWVGYVMTGATGGEWLDRVQLSTGLTHEFQPQSAAFGPTLGRTLGGALTFSRVVSGGNAVFMTWPFDGSTPVTLQTPSTPGFVLPGS